MRQPVTYAAHPWGLGLPLGPGVKPSIPLCLTFSPNLSNNNQTMHHTVTKPFSCNITSTGDHEITTMQMRHWYFRTNKILIIPDSTKLFTIQRSKHFSAKELCFWLLFYFIGGSRLFLSMIMYQFFLFYWYLAAVGIWRQTISHIY